MTRIRDILRRWTPYHPTNVKVRLTVPRLFVREASTRSAGRYWASRVVDLGVACRRSLRLLQVQLDVRIDSEIHSTAQLRILIHLWNVATHTFLLLVRFGFECKMKRPIYIKLSMNTICIHYMYTICIHYMYTIYIHYNYVSYFIQLLILK